SLPTSDVLGIYPLVKKAKSLISDGPIKLFAYQNRSILKSCMPVYWVGERAQGMQMRDAGPEFTAKSNFTRRVCLRLADRFASVAGAIGPRTVVVGSARAIGGIASVTAGLVVLKYSLVIQEIEHLSLLMYLAVVVLAATRWGPLPAIITALVAS